MNWSLDLDKVERGFVSPPTGRARYKITELKLAVDKKDLSGKSQQIVMAFKGDGGSYSYVFKVMAANADTQRIAKQHLAQVADAAGIKGVLKPERFKSFAGKELEMEFSQSEGKDANKGKFFTNFSGAWPAAASEQEEEEQEEEEQEEQESEESEEETTEEEAPKPAAKKELPWKAKKK